MSACSTRHCAPWVPMRPSFTTRIAERLRGKPHKSTAGSAYAEIGLGKQMSHGGRAPVAGARVRGSSHRPDPAHITIHGTEGISRPIGEMLPPHPWRPYPGVSSRRTSGFIIHTHDCPGISAFHGDPDKWLDVEWETPSGHLSTSTSKLVVANRRGVLAKVAAAIAEQGINIGNIAMEEEDGSPYTVPFFTLQVESRITWPMSCARCAPCPTSFVFTASRAARMAGRKAQ